MAFTAFPGRVSNEVVVKEHSDTSNIIGESILKKHQISAVAGGTADSTVKSNFNDVSNKQQP